VATLTASHHPERLPNLLDENAMTNWEARLGKGESEMWIEANFDEPVTIGAINAARGETFSPQHVLELLVPDGPGAWKTVSPKNWRVKWEPITILDEPVSTDRIRMRITKTSKFQLAELELFPPH
jgi:hypothetical protein